MVYFKCKQKLRHADKIALWEFHYHWSYQLLRKIGAFWDGDSHPVDQGHCASRLYSDFFASCRSAKRRVLEPFTERLDARCRFGSFAPHYCLRQLALIEFPNKTFKDIPSVCKTCPCVAGHKSFPARFHIRLIPSKRFGKMVLRLHSTPSNLFEL